MKRVQLPANLGMCMVDIDSGSDTRVLVKKVLEWEKANRNAQDDAAPEMFSAYEFQKMKECQYEVLDILTGEWDEFGLEDDVKIVRLNVLCEKVLEY